MCELGIQDGRRQFGSGNWHWVWPGEFLDPLNPTAQSFLEQTQAEFYRQTGDLAISHDMALQALANLRNQQASSLAYFDMGRRHVSLRPGAAGVSDEMLGDRKGHAGGGGVGRAKPREWLPAAHKKAPAIPSSATLRETLHPRGVGDIGLEQVADCPGKTGICDHDGAESGAPGAQVDPDLAAVVKVWPTLPAAIKAAILAMVQSAG